jgi:hypothetical protein
MQIAWALPTFLISVLKVPLLSNTWMRAFPASAASRCSLSVVDQSHANAACAGIFRNASGLRLGCPDDRQVAIDESTPST